MQTFVSTTSTKNNICFSEVSQEDAELKAKEMDDNNCYNCYNCYYCNHCNCCNNCSHCTYCNYCHHCHHCHQCNNCYRCYQCHCCNYCDDCSNYVIQAGYHNGYWCYGSLKGDTLSIQCGCKVKSYAGAIAYWSNKPHRKEILAACEFIATVARQRNWNL